VKALDTNVIVRYLVADDDAMASRALQLLKQAHASQEAFLITTPVFLELLWVLQAKYRLTREDICEAVQKLEALPMIRFDYPALVREFVLASQSTNLDLADLLIGLHAKNSGAETVLTFDRKAARNPLFEAI